MRCACLADPFEEQLYTLYSDAETITEESTASFLQQLEQQLKANAAAFNLQNPSQNMTKTLEEFSAVAADILNYFRERNSQALLSMLRQFSQQGTFTLADVDPDVLQQEVQKILDVDQLGKYYARVSQRHGGGEGITTRPSAGAQVWAGLLLLVWLLHLVGDRRGLPAKHVLQRGNSNQHPHTSASLHTAAAVRGS